MVVDVPILPKFVWEMGGGAGVNNLWWTFLSYPSNHSRGSQVKESLPAHCIPRSNFGFSTQPLDSQLEAADS